MEEVKKFLKLRTHWSISSIYIEGNRAGYLLAKLSLAQFDEIIWIARMPPLISIIVLEELFNQ